MDILDYWISKYKLRSGANHVAKKDMCVRYRSSPGRTYRVVEIGLDLEEEKEKQPSPGSKYKVVEMVVVEIFAR